MKTLETPRDKILVISVLVVALGIFLAGIGGIVLALLLITITGVFYGIHKKERQIWKPFLIASIIILIGIVSFLLLLHYSDM